MVSKEALFVNESLEYFVKTRANYRGLCKLLLNAVIKLELRPT
jgi:hypothetical protein